MKKVVFTIASMVLLAVCVQAQSVVKPVTSTTSAAGATNTTSNAEITFETDVHDFGTIEHGANGSYEFKFKNTGTEPLIITEAKGSCGCTVPTYPKNVPIKPGETQVIKVTYDTKRVGNFLKTVTIQSNAKTHVSVITIKGTVLAEVTEEVFPTSGKSENGAIPFEKH